jgi:hypothetical protein
MVVPFLTLTVPVGVPAGEVTVTLNSPVRPSLP